MVLPPYLSQGSKVGIMCPAGALSLEDVMDMKLQVEAWGFIVEIGQTVGSVYNKFSAPDVLRASELQHMLDDDSLEAILFGRGGYGLVRIIDTLNFSHFAKHPKWLVGYSDVTCLHSHVHTQLGIATLHAHMSGGYHASNADTFSTESIYHALTGKKAVYLSPAHTMNRVGEAQGVMVGGNLALLSDLVGTASDIETHGKILFIEDIAEYKYNIDRMLWQLLRAGKLSNLAGLLVGGFTDTQDNEVPFGMSEYDMVWEKIRTFDYPVAFDFPVGHQPRNVALKIGATYSLSVDNQGACLTEL